jgi:heptosyltransferase III
LKSDKVLAIQFKYLGDAVILTPALKALKMQMPNIELHVLVAAEVAPLLSNLPWITKVWAMPRVRGKANLTQSIPFIKALRKEGFDKCIDFGGNDRGAFLSRACGAPIRLGSSTEGKVRLLQKICYTHVVNFDNTDVPQTDLHFKLLDSWGVLKPKSIALEIACNPSYKESAEKILPINTILCHIATSQPKKDWPISHWKKLHHLAQEAGIKMVFSSGTNERERKLLGDLIAVAPEVDVLPPIQNLDLFLNVLKHSKLVVAGDTGPLHFAAGLGVPVLGIFGVGNSLTQAVPLYKHDQIIKAQKCACYSEFSHLNFCNQDESCMKSIKPEAVFLKLQNILLKDKKQF